MKLRPFTKENIEEVMNNLSSTSKEELEVFKLTVNDLRDRFMNMIGMPFTSAFYAEDEVCCALCGLENLGRKKYQTHFVEREGGFERILRPLTEFFKQITDDLVQYENASFEILSAFGEDTKAWKWFLLMGFELIETKNKVSKYRKGW